MSGSGKLPHWQRVALNKFDEVRDHPDFADDVELVRSRIMGKVHDLAFDGYIRQLMRKYDMPRYMYPFFKEFIILEEVNVGVLIPPLFLIDEFGRKAYPSDHSTGMWIAYKENDAATHTPKLYIEIGPDTQREDLEGFIADYYAVIDEVLHRHFKDRTGAHQNKYTLKERYAVIQSYKDKVNDPAYTRKVYDAVQRETGISPDRVRKFIHEYRMQKKYDIKIPEDNVAP